MNTRIQKIKATIIFSILFVFLENTYAQALYWANGGNMNTAKIIADASGNVYIVGSFQNTVDFDPGPSTTTIVAQGGNDAFVAKYNSNGALIWVYPIASVNNEACTALAIDKFGSLWIGGSFTGSIDFDIGPGTTSLTAAGSSNIFLLKLNQSGNFLQAKRYQCSSVASVVDMSTDRFGRIIMVGNFSGVMDFDPNAGSQLLTSTSSNDAFVARVQQNGTSILYCNIGGASNGIFPKSVAVDKNGQIYFTGYFQGTVDMDPGIGAVNIAAAGAKDCFVEKLDSNGIYQWAFKLGGNSNNYGGADEGTSIAVDTLGNAYVGGVCCSNGAAIDFDPGLGTANISTGFNDLAWSGFVAKYNTNGNYMWAYKTNDGSTFLKGPNISIDDTANVFVHNHFWNTYDMDPGTGVRNITSGGTGPSLYLAKYNTNFVFKWGIGLINTASSPITSDLFTDKSGANCYITGQCVNTIIDFNPSLGNTSYITGNTYYARYGPCFSPTITTQPPSFTVCAGANAVFTIAASGSSPDYQWQVNQGSGFNNIGIGFPYTGATAASLTLATTQAAMSGWQFRCIVSSLCGPTYTSAASILTVIGIPQFPGPISGLLSTCAGSTLNYSVSVNPIVTSYSWTLPSGWTGSSTSNVISATTGTSNGIVSVSASNSCGTSALATLGVLSASVPNTPSPISGSTSVCANTAQQYLIAPVAGAASYSWSTLGGLQGVSSSNIIFVNVGSLSGGTLSVVASNSCGISPSQSLGVVINPLPTITVNSGTICQGSSFTITPSGANTYTIQGGNASVSPNANSSYTVVGTSLQGCVSQSFETANVTVRSNPTITVNNGSICSGESFTIIPSGANTYTIQGGNSVVNPNASTSYTVRGTNTEGCVSANTATLNLTVNTTPTVTVNSGTICTGESFTIVPSGANNYTIQGGSNIVNPNTNSSYTVAGSSSEGCISVNTATSNITVYTTPTVTVNNGTICSGESFTLIPSGANTYTIQGGNNVVNPNSTTNYTVAGSSSDGCISANTATANVSVNPLPTIGISAASTVICVGESMDISATGANSFTWNTSANSSSISVSPVITTTYSVSGQDANACENTSAFTLQVDECTGIANISKSEAGIMLYPNPNNGLFYIETSQSLAVSIYNSLGQLILQQKVSEGKNQINLHEQANGIYFIEINQNGKTNRMKLIKE